MTTTRFRALPVLSGDAFLLGCSRGKYLIDGGDAPNGLLPRLLDARGAKALRAVICTSTAGHHFGAVPDLLEHGRPVRELWLPASLGRLCRAGLPGPGEAGKGTNAKPLADLRDLAPAGPRLALWAARVFLCPDQDPARPLADEPSDPAEALAHVLALLPGSWNSGPGSMPAGTGPDRTAAGLAAGVV